MNDYDLVATTEPDLNTTRITKRLVGNETPVDDVEQNDGSPLTLDHDAADDDNEEESDGIFRDIATTPSVSQILHQTLLPDAPLKIYQQPTLDGPPAIKLVKFLVVTALLIVVMYHVIRLLDWEHNSQLNLHDLYTYQSPLIIQDAIVYFVVGRLCQRRGIDHLAWIGTCLAACVFSSLLTRVRFLQHSATLYEIHCRWPWQLFAFVLVVAPVVVAIILAHVHLAVQEQRFVSKLLELILCLAVFLGPYLPSKYLHLHHWYVGWLFGMHFNVDVWWSRAASAWCWGLYINGVAAYAHDPVLTCGYSYWLSEHMECPYLQCYLEELEHPTAQNDTHHVDPMVTPDWRNCSSDSYHP